MFTMIDASSLFPTIERLLPCEHINTGYCFLC